MEHPADTFNRCIESPHGKHEGTIVWVTPTKLPPTAEDAWQRYRLSRGPICIQECIHCRKRLS